MARHRYRVYDVGVDGSHHLTDKIITCEPPEFNRYGELVRRGDAVSELFRLFNYNSGYNDYYKPHIAANNIDIEIKYNYNLGIKTTWYLKRGV